MGGGWSSTEYFVMGERTDMIKKKGEKMDVAHDVLAPTPTIGAGRLAVVVGDRVGWVGRVG